VTTDAWRTTVPAVVLASLLLGVAFTVELAGRPFVVSWIDLTAYAVGAAAVVCAVRRGRLVVDHALAAYAAFLLVVALQAAVAEQPLELLGGASRFVTAAAVLVAAGQAFGAAAGAPPATPTRSDRPPWVAPLLAFGAVLGAWVVVRLLVALTDPALGGFYAVKNAVVTPLGASNTLAGYLVVPTAAGAVLARYDRRVLLPAGLSAAGVVATLSRGAVAALLVTALGLAGAALLRRRRAALLAVAGAVATVVVLAGAVVLAGGEPVADTRLGGVTAGSPDGRLALWRTAAGAVVDAPLLGVGLNRLPTVTAGLAQPHDHAHNLELHALAESGLVGGLAYLALWGLLAWRLWRARPGPLRDALAAGALALFLHAQVEALSYQRGIEVLVALLLAAGAALPGAGATGTWRWRRPEPVPARR
jgi:hypothetical protein